MTPVQLVALGSAFAGFLRHFETCFAQARSAQHLHAYCRGLLSDLPRKSIEPIALACGTAVRTLQEFLRDHVWDHLHMRDLLQQRLAQQPVLAADDELGTIGIIDETSVPKKGCKTPGVQRQWCGALGKTENCVVTVHLAVVRGHFKTLVDADLYVPKVWHDDRERCREADIPDDVVYRPKWRIALEQLARARANGLRLDWLTFDEHYGSKPGFLEELEQRPDSYFVGEIPRNFRCLAVRPRGKRPRKGWTGKRVDWLAKYSSAWNRRTWHGVSLARLTLDNQEWEVRAGQVYVVRQGELSERTYWLIVARSVATDELKYFLSNAPLAMPVEQLLRVAFCRWHVEHTFRVVKTEIGFGHFEGRSYVALLRHMILCLVVLGFVAEHTDRLRGEKPGDHLGAGVPSVEPTLSGVAREPPGHTRSRVYDEGHRLSPNPQSRRTPLTAKAETAANLAL